MLTAVSVLGLVMLVVPGSAPVSGPRVDVWLTTTSDADGRVVDKGLEPQPSTRFGESDPAAGQLIEVDQGTTYQEFEGGGASFTDTAAWLMRGSGALDEADRDKVMEKLFDRREGIGLGFLRNPMGASDLARYAYSYDRTCCDLSDFSMDKDADVMALTKQAASINPGITVKAVPWSSPAWMKDNNDIEHRGWLRHEYYDEYAQYFVKYIQAYAKAGVDIDYVSPQNEPGCCYGTDYPSMNWNADALRAFTKDHLWPAFRKAGIDTKTLVFDWNWKNFPEMGAEQLADAELVDDPLFGGIAWHGYAGDPSTQSEVHKQYPGVKSFNTENSGGGWVDDQQREDMLNLIDYTRNWGRSWVKWSLAMDQNNGPTSGGCGTCTGLITVHNGGKRHGQVDYTVEYYTMGHLTKFVEPGAVRVASTDGAVRNVAWRNPDGSTALIAYNDTDKPRTIRIKADGHYASYRLPARASATFTWGG